MSIEGRKKEAPKPLSVASSRTPTAVPACNDEARFRSLVEQAPFSIQVFSPDGRTLRVNRAWENLFGVAAEQVLALYNIFEDRQLEENGTMAILRRAFAGEAVRLPPIQYDPNSAVPGIVPAEDARRWLSAVAYPIMGADGRVEEVVMIHEDISVRMRAEEDRERSDQQIRNVLESISDGVFAVDGNWRLTYFNPQAEKLLNRKAGDLLGRSIWEEYPGLAGSEFERTYRRVATERITESVSAYYPDHDRWYEDKVYPATGGGISVYFQDVTERKRAEAELARLTAASEQQRRMYETALSNSADFNYVIDRDGRFLFVNQAFLTLGGRELHEVVGRNFFELDYPHDLAARLQRQIREVIETGRTVRDDAPYSSGAGDREYEYIFSPVLGAAGEVEAVAGSSRDITDRKRAEEALRESERLYRAIGESIEYGVWVCDPEGRNTYASESFLRLVGMTQQECAEFGWGRVLHPDDVERTLAAWQASVETGGQWDVEVRYRGIDGLWHPVLARGVPVRNEEGEITAWAGINLDISRLKQVEVELREADRRKDEFLAILAHELRNPLAPIRNALEILKMPRLDSATARRAQEMMERQVHHLVRLVDDLLDVSRVMRDKIELRREQVELAAIVARAVETAQPLIELQGHRLEIALAPESLLLDADPVRLSQVVANLLTNAAKYTDPKGHIVLSARRDHGHAVLAVSDNGIGIDPEMLPRIFELFVQADHEASRSHGGLGIGLTLVQKLVEMHEGTVAAFSGGLGKGCEFVVRLPLVPQPAGNPAEGDDAGHREVAPRGSGLRLLVVDDNRDAAVSLAMLLRLQGHEVQIANDGTAALDVAASYVPDLVFLDLGMPGMDGYEVARRMRRQPALGNAVLAALTGWGQNEDRRRSAEAGFDHHLVKPLEPEVLKCLLEELANAHRP